MPIDFMYLYEMTSEDIDKDVDAARAALKVIQNEWIDGHTPEQRMFLEPILEKAQYELHTFIKNAERIQNYQATQEDIKQGIR